MNFLQSQGPEDGGITSMHPSLGWLMGLPEYISVAAEVKALRFANLQIPDYKIPDWPKDLIISIELGRRKFEFPYYYLGGYFKARKIRRSVEFNVLGDGMMGFKFYGTLLGDQREICFSAELEMYNQRRVQFFYLLRLFGKECFTKLRDRLVEIDRLNGQYHNGIVSQALSTFFHLVVAEF